MVEMPNDPKGQLQIQELQNQKKVTTPFWYAMRVIYRKEEKIKQELDALGITSFIPYIVRYEKKRKQVRRIVEPAIHNLIFIHASEQFIQGFKKDRTELQYIVSRVDKSVRKTIVPDDQMEQFMELCAIEDQTLRVESLSTLDLKPGQQIRIVSGPLKGMVGCLKRIQGSRKRRFVISIPGLLSASIAEVSPLDVEKYEE